MPRSIISSKSTPQPFRNVCQIEQEDHGQTDPSDATSIRDSKSPTLKSEGLKDWRRNSDGDGTDRQQ